MNLFKKNTKLRFILFLNVQKVLINQSLDNIFILIKKNTLIRSKPFKKYTLGDEISKIIKSPPSPDPPGPPPARGGHGWGRDRGEAEAAAEGEWGGQQVAAGGGEEPGTSKYILWTF